MELVVLLVGLFVLIAIPILIVKALVGWCCSFKLVRAVFQVILGAFALVAKLLFGGLGLLLEPGGPHCRPGVPACCPSWRSGLVWLIVRAGRTPPARLPA